MRLLKLSLFFLILLSACRASPPSPASDPALLMTQAVATVWAAATQTVAAQPTATFTPPPPTATPTPPRTPPALPPLYTTSLLNPLDTPHAYIQDTCQYLKAKWDPNNAAPGTVVMVIMFHSITKGEATNPYQISASEQRMILRDLKEQGFEAINIQQLADFLYRNARIPRRSVVLIVDDRHHAEYFNNHFRPFYEQWGWPVVNAYIAKDERPDLWQENAALAAEGWVDYQAHGVIHNDPIGPASTEEYMRGELFGAKANLEKYFHKTPIAYIWPGGGFTPRAVQIARQAGYQLGFTINPRGPLMFNWVPLADAPDPNRPAYLAEGPAADPLMTLPRYWDKDARAHLDTVRRIGNEAAAYAEQHRAAEIEYYNIVCAPTYGPLPQGQ
jgi:hypothetical protein